MTRRFTVRMNRSEFALRRRNARTLASLLDHTVVALAAATANLVASSFSLSFVPRRSMRRPKHPKHLGWACLT